MDTPILDFLISYAKSNGVRAHMPGHKGKRFLGCEKLDITEIDGADVLYKAQSVILKSRENASKIFDSKATFYSTEGCSLPIRAAVFMCCAYATETGKKRLFIATPNVHKSFISALALSEADCIFTSGGPFSAKVDLGELDTALKKSKAVAFYITSPDYLGYISDIGSVAEVCHKNNALLVVDNAHGSYLKFAQNYYHPLELGADIVCDSAHKTLPVLTGGAYLHIGKSAPDFFMEKGEFALSLFASTSPSYVIMASLDNFNKELSGGYFKKQEVAVQRAGKLKVALTKKGYFLIGGEPLKITIFAKKYGYYGYEIAKILKGKKIFVEFYDKDFVTLMLSPQNSARDYKKIEKALSGIPQKEPIYEIPPIPQPRKRAISIRKALLSQSESLPTAQAEGRVLSYTALSCPPAIPIAISGEILDKNAIEMLIYYGIETVNVVK